jgi:hypothetical protein
MIEKLRVRNFRCLRDVEVPLGPLNFLIGPNNTGKSSFLDAMDVLCRSVKQDNVSQAFVPRERTGRPENQPVKRFERILTHGNCQARLEYECDLSWSGANLVAGQWHYQLSLSLGPPRPTGDRRIVVVDETIRTPLPAPFGLYARAARRSPPPFAMPDGTTVDLPNPSDESTMMHWLAGQDKGGIQTVLHCLCSTPAYSLVAERIAQPCDVTPPLLAPDGYGLASVLDSFADREPQRFKVIEDALRRFVPAVEYVTFPTLEHNEKTILFHEHGRAKVYASEASAGLLLLLAYLSLAYAHGDVGVLLVEEPETGVHPRRLQDIVHLLRAISRGELGLPPVQVIATSHSPILVDCCDKSEIVVFQRSGDGDVHATPFSQIPDIDDRLQDFSPGELIFTMGEQICGSRS